MLCEARQMGLRDEWLDRPPTLVVLGIRGYWGGCREDVRVARHFINVNNNHAWYFSMLSGTLIIWKY